MDSIDARNESYFMMVNSSNLNNLQEGILRFIKLNPDSTDQYISEMLDLELSCVNGRRNELVEKGLILDSGKNYNSGRPRTTWRIATAEEYVKFKQKETCLNNKDMNQLIRLISKLLYVNNKTQINIIKKMLEIKE